MHKSMTYSNNLSTTDMEKVFLRFGYRTTARVFGLTHGAVQYQMAKLGHTSAPTPETVQENLNQVLHQWLKNSRTIEEQEAFNLVQTQLQTKEAEEILREAQEAKQKQQESLVQYMKMNKQMPEHQSSETEYFVKMAELFMQMKPEDQKGFYTGLLLAYKRSQEEYKSTFTRMSFQ